MPTDKGANKMEKNPDIKVVSAKVNVDDWNAVLEKSFKDLHEVKASKVIPFLIEQYLAN